MSRYPKGNSALDIMLNGLLALLSWVVPKDRRLVLAGSLRGQHFRGNPKYLFLHLCATPRAGLRPLWITASERVHDTLQARGLPVVRLRSPAGFWAVLRAGHLVISHSIEDVSYFQFLPGRFHKIHAYHGLPLKGFIPDLKRRRPWPLGYLLLKHERRSNALFLTTSAHTAALEQGFLYPTGTVLGYPRNDVFSDPARVFDSYRDSLGLDRFAKVILYCPTFRDFDRPAAPFPPGRLDQLAELLRARNYLLLVSSHHLDDTLDLRANTSPHIVDINGRFEDIQDLLPDIDVMVSDYSSIVYDFMLSGRPIIYYCHDYERYLAERGFLIDYFNDLPGPFCHSFEALLDTIATLDDWTGDAGYRRHYQQVTDLFHHYQDGRASERLAALLSEGGEA